MEHAITGTIAGSAGKKKIYFKYIPCSRASRDFFIFFHGSFSTSYSGQKSDIIARGLSANGLGNVFLYETSRQVYSFETDLPFQEYKKAFGQKTYADELQDVKAVFAYFLDTFVKNRAGCRLHFVGSSLGGTQCSYLLPEYGGMVKDVFLFGSGVTTKAKGSTYPGYPAKEEILRNYQTYKGSVCLVQGSEDEVVPKREAMEVFKYLKEGRKTHITIDGVDHSFRKYNGKEAVPQVARMILQILKDHADFG